MTASLPPAIRFQPLVAGAPIPGGKVYFYAAGTSTPQAVYAPDGTTPLTNPLILDANGATQFRLGTGLSYKIDLTLSDGTPVLGWPQDGIQGTDSGIARLALSDGSDQIGYIAPYTGASARTVGDKLDYIVMTSDFPSLAAAISGVGSANTLLLVNSPVTVSSDLTIPSNVSTRVEGLGIIMVSAGKRLFINGPFSADRLHRCFNAALLSTTLTASINGNALVVTSASADVLAPGHVITGTGVELGQIIQATYGNTSTGTYSLSSYGGIVSSRTMTATGPSIIFGAGVVDCVYPQWFGAVADTSVTDNGPYLAHAVYSMPWGGTVRIPAGIYKAASADIAGHALLQIIGDGATDNGTGSPPNGFTVPSYIWLSSDNTNLFNFGGTCSHAVVKDIGIGAQATFGGSNLTAIGANRKGVVYTGHAGQTVYGPRIENVWFFNLTMGIHINDSWAGTGDGVGGAGTYWDGSSSLTYYDWAVNPGSIQNCHTIGCTYGMHFNTGNADAWTIRDSVFIIPANSFGIYQRRCGFMKVDNCFAFGTSMTGSKFIDLAYVGTDSADDLTIDNCQAEYCANFLNLETTATNVVPPTITVRNSIHQLGSDVSLGRPCDYISQGNEILSNVTVLSNNVRIHSFVDKFFATDFIPGHTTFGFNWGVYDYATVYTYVPGFYPCTSFSGPISMGIRTTFGTAAPAAGTWGVADRCIRNPPVVGQPKAWSCTVAGTPGTWVSEGNL